MKIYSKTPTPHAWFYEKFTPLEQCEYLDGSIFWYDQHAKASFRLNLEDGIGNRAWELLRRDKTSKIILFFGDEYFNYIDVKEWAETIKKQNIDPKQFYLVCMDKNWEGWALKSFSDLGVNGISIQSFNILVKMVQHIPKQKSMEHRFSIFSRNYNQWRLALYLKLQENGILDNSFFTFNNIYPYGERKTYGIDTMIRDAKNANIKITPELQDWLSKVPYTFSDANNVNDKWNNKIYDALTSSGINLVVESHYDPFWNFAGYRERMGPEKFSPFFATEKVYKAISCEKPFIMFSTPWFLKDMKKLGYKTFDPFINETYDSVENDSDRLDAIVTEMKRLNDLSTDDFKELLDNLTDTCKHNFELFKENHRAQKFEDDFSWLNGYFKTSYQDIKKIYIEK